MLTIEYKCVSIDYNKFERMVKMDDKKTIRDFLLAKAGRFAMIGLFSAGKH